MGGLAGAVRNARSDAVLGRMGTDTTIASRRVRQDSCVSLRLLTIREAAEELGRARSWVEDRIKDGSLPHTVYGGRRYVAARDLERLLPDTPEDRARRRDEARITIMPRRWV